MGSGGASQTGSVGGPGGASVSLSANTLTISGLITVNGSQGTDYAGLTGDGGGGGAGGGILIRAKDVSIAGTLSATGLRGGNSVPRKGGGGGAGGRIKIFCYGTLDKTGASFPLAGGAGGTGPSGNGVAGESGTYYEEGKEDGRILVYKVTMSGTEAEADSNGWLLGRSSGSSYLVLSMVRKDANLLNYAQLVDYYTDKVNNKPTKLYEISTGSENFTQNILPGRPPKRKNIASVNIEFEANNTGLLLGTVSSTDIGTLDANDKKTKVDVATSLKGFVRWGGSEDNNEIGYGTLSATLDAKWTKTANDPCDAKGFGGNIVSFLDPNSDAPKGLIYWLKSTGYKLP
jgi:hypothetical protein